MISYKLQFRIFLAVFALFAFGFILQNYPLLLRAIDTSLLVIIGALLYIASQLFRAIRLRFMLASADFKTKDAITTQFGSVSLGNFLMPFAKDILACYLYFLTNNKDISRILISLLYIRFFDFLVISPMLFVLVLSGSTANQGIAFTVFAFMIVIFVLLLTLPNLSKFIRDFLITYSHNKQSLVLVKFISHLKDVYEDMHLDQINKAFMVFLFTISAWAFELVGIYFVSGLFDARSIEKSYYSVVSNVMTNMPFNNAFATNPELYNLPYLFLIVFTLVFLFTVRRK